MCGYCGQRASSDDVVAALTRDGSSETRIRLRLARLASDVVGVAGIRVRAWSDRFLVANRTGSTLVVHRFAEVAVAASRLAGRPIGDIDPFSSHESGGDR